MAPGAGFAVLPTVGGQTALNLAIELSDGGVLEKYDVHLIWRETLPAIKKAEDRLFFKDAMQKIGLDVPKSALVNNTKDGLEFAGKIGFPVIVAALVHTGRFAVAVSLTTARRWLRCCRAGSIFLRCMRR